MGLPCLAERSVPTCAKHLTVGRLIILAGANVSIRGCACLRAEQMSSSLNISNRAAGREAAAAH